MARIPAHSGARARVIGFVLCLAELLGMSLWFTASAVTPYLQARWSLDDSAAGWLTTIVQLGFVAGTATVALLNLADLWPARWLVAGACLLASVANALVLPADSYPLALALRFLTGFFLAGVYPPAMKMIATWFLERRGLAIGALVGALTIGKALPYLVRALRAVSPSFVMLSASGGAIVAALLVAFFYYDGPHTFERRRFSWGLIGTVVRHRETRLAIAGYLGHMWELYAMWSLISLFFLDFFTGSGAALSAASARSGVAGFGAIAIGALGCVVAGRWADVIGRERVTIIAMAMSATCSLIMGHLLISSLWLAAIVGGVWGFSVVADSAQFSAIVTEVSPRHAVGTALTLQTSLGFLLTALAIPATIEVHHRFGWAAAFSLLAVGPVFGIAAMVRLKSVRFGATSET